MNSSDKKITLKDIANSCNYSVNTVSRALRGDPHIPDATKDKIKETAERLGYIRNIMASSLRSGKTHVIAILVEEIKNPHYSYLVTKINDLLHQNRYVSMVLLTHNDPVTEEQMVNIAISHSVDGIVLFPSGAAQKAALLLQKSKIPHVIIDRRIEGIENVDIVRLNDTQGGHMAAKILLDLGHRSILYLAGPLTNGSQIERQAGMMEAVKEAGIPESCIRIIPSEQFLQMNEQKQLSKLLLPLTYTAIIAFNDERGYYAMHSLKEEGIQIPEQVSIISFDNLHHVVKYLPTISSISHVSGNDIATAAAKLLLDLISGSEGHIPSDNMFPVALHDGGTLAAPRK